MANLERVGAFVEYVIRPLSEDWKVILDQLKALNIGVTPELLKQTTIALGLWHLAGELLRALCYITIVVIVCQTLQTLLLSPLSSQ